MRPSSLFRRFPLAHIALAATAAAQDSFDWTPGVLIPDNNPVGVADTRNITFDPGAVITGLEVRLQLSGGWNGDIYASLVHDSGFTVLLNRPGVTSLNPAGSGSSGMNITFSDSASTDIHTGIPNSGFVTGTWQPDGRTADPLFVTDASTRSAFLASFNDAPVKGNWTLFLADNATADTSTITGWGLTIFSEIRPFSVWDANGDIAGAGGAGAWSSTSTTWATSHVGTSTAAQTVSAQLKFSGSGGAIVVSDTVAPQNGLHFQSTGYSLTGGTISMEGASASENSITVATGATATIHSVLDGSAGVSKDGAGTLVLTGANTFAGGFSLDVGTLSVENTTGSATGGGGLVTALGTTLAGNGIIAPTGSAGINVSGQISPGTSIGALTFDLSATSGSVVMEAGSGLTFELGTANSAIDSIGLNTSDLVQVIGGGPGDFVFNGNVIDFGFGGSNGFYKLFDTAADSADVWSGLTFDSETGLISSGLSFVNLAPERSGQLLVGTAFNGGNTGDVYLQVIPEPGFAFIGSIGMMLLLRRRR